jgi:ABC-type iron transport system FetAB ATPase subunit
MRTGLRLEAFGCRCVERVDLTVAPGHCLGLTGPSGSGKSLFLRALADLDPYTGRMLLDDRDAARIPAPQWRRQVAFLQAESAWWFDTVGEHFGTLPSDWLEGLGFDERVMTWQVSHLSSGERQRLALLRMLVNQPKVLLLDEPTANLDALNTERVELLLDKIRRQWQPATLWVAHDLAQLKRWCDPIWVLEGSRLNPLHSALEQTGARTEARIP